MKKMLINKTTSILSIILILSVASCSKEKSENIVSEGSSQKIIITGADANTTTKTTLNQLVTSWIQTTDKVGIYSSQARTATAGGGSEIVNAQFTAASSGVSSSFDGTMFWGVANTSHTFYAYYPYAAGSPAATAVPISLPAAQTQSSANSNAHIGALDFMVATPVTQNSPDNTNATSGVNLKYNHLFTVIEFQIKGSGDLKAVKLAANTTLAFSGGTIDITQATPTTDVAYTFASQTGTTTEAVVTLTTPATLTANNTDTKVYMVINPGTPTGNCIISLSTDGTTWKYINKAAPAGGFKRGVKYVVTVDASSASALGAGEVVTLTGRIWMDKNLGATRVATSSTDADAYGYLYQWGRGTDGHQIRTSGTTTTLSNSDVPGHANFITSSDSPYDWRSPQNVNLWQGTSGTNNPCPEGFRLPTDTEWNNERLTWATNNPAGAFASPLKLTLAGVRRHDTGEIVNSGLLGNYWSSTVSYDTSQQLEIRSSFNDASISNNARIVGYSVRCIKD